MKTAGCLARIRNTGWRAEAEIAERFVLLAWREALAETHDPDVAREANHVRERQAWRSVNVVDRAAERLVFAVVRLDDFIDPRLAAREQRRRSEGLERGARLVRLD